MREPQARIANRIDLQVELSYEVAAPGADFVFNIHAARTPSQTLSAEQLVLSQALEPQPQAYTDPISGNRYLRLHAAPGALKVSYAVCVDLMHHRDEPSQIDEVPICELPPQVMGYIYPSRYCQADRLLTLATAEFGKLGRGYERVQAIRDWVHSHVTSSRTRRTRVPLPSTR